MLLLLQKGLRLRSPSRRGREEDEEDSAFTFDKGEEAFDEGEEDFAFDGTVCAEVKNVWYSRGQFKLLFTMSVKVGGHRPGLAC